ncbi:VWA domain-containing protein [Nocardioides sp. AX2bis]|uniref:VWA domain-containing protein n=1 Tax=Nocardioides sp. AX2bis TaxID=2653157 RepID=UPI0012F03E55|nr:VWA domain-containing protein [Nocardioides sp. AX2bis]VXC50708.1 Magnesium chelatase [Nocardioides sp. AX2bis]
MPAHYPFSAVVPAGATGNPDAASDGAPDGRPGDLDPMALALVLTTISPAIGGVLVRGEKGTAKSTIVRALAAVLPPVEVVAGDRFSSDPTERGRETSSPDGPFAADAAVESRPVRLVELPVGATEDRVLGSLHLERALSQGTAEYEPGLLARAHRGILYVDEVNLLHDHLVDLLLDAAAMGRATVERDGVSVSHAARFVLVGTMNPEEGELRPQLLDRFGLTAEVAAPRDPARRVEVVRRRMAYDADPDAFAATWAPDEEALRARVAAAQALVGEVVVGDGALLRIAELCAALDVDGMRADIVTARTAAAHAAWHGRRFVTTEDIRAAARLSLPHRRRRNPFDAPGLDEDLLDDLLPEDPDEPDPEPPGGGDGGGDDGDGAGGDGGGDGTSDAPDGSPDGTHDAAPDPGTADGGTSDAPVTAPDGTHDATPDAAPDPAPDPAAAPPPGGKSTVGAGSAYRARLLAVRGTGEGEAGRRSRAVTSTGRRTGARPGRQGAVHLGETVRAAAPHQVARGRVPGAGGRVLLRPDDLRVAVREGQESNLVLFCVDASGSMAARRRMEEVKAAILSLLLDAYRRRDKVGLVTFRGTGAELTLPPTRSVDVAAARLEVLPAGGRTPLAEGLLEAARCLEVERVRDPRRRPLLVVVTDGRATAGADAVDRSRGAADLLAAAGVGSVVVDCESGPMRMGLARSLADHLGAEHVPVGEVSADALAAVARPARPAGPARPAA